MSEDNKQKSSDHLYLEKLEFDPQLRKTWLNFFISNFRVIILLIVLISGWGIYSFIRLPRESNPEVKIPIAVVFTTYPGVAPSDMEELVTKKIEAGIAGIKGIKKLTSSSANSVSSITVEFDAKENLEDSLRKLRDEVNNIKTELSDDASEPTVKEISFDDRPVLSLAVTGPYDGFSLRKYADDMKDELEKVPGVREVNVSGGDELEFEVAYDPQKLTFYKISPDQANQAIKASNLAIPAGTFEGKDFSYPIRADARFFDIGKLQNMPITHGEDGGIVYLKDIADVKEHAIKKTVYSRLSMKGQAPEEAVTIDIVKKTGGSVIKIVDESKSALDSVIERYPKGVKYDVTTDYAKFIRDDFEQLTHDFFITLALVFVILFLIVGLKEALVAGLAIPLVFFISFGVMDITGTSLNFLSMFSLLLSLGLLVDDAIVVVSATKQYLNTGKYTPEEAVLLVLNDFKVVLTTTTLTTVWAFLPLLLSTGIMGSFIKSIPITVSVTLVASLLVALMINHPLAAVLERIRLTARLFFLYIIIFLGLVAAFIGLKSITGYVLAAFTLFIVAMMVRWYLKGGKEKLKKNSELSVLEWVDDEKIKEKLRDQGNGNHTDASSRLLHGAVKFHKVIPVYEKYLRKALDTKKRRWAVMAATLALFIAAILMPITGIVPSEFFPASDQGMIFVSLRAPTGLNLENTNKITRQVEEQLLKYPEISNFSTLVGTGGSSGGINGGVGVSSGSSNRSSITINLKDEKDRDIKSYDLATKIRRDLANIQGAEITIETPSAGPPSGSSFEARIAGDDLQELDRIANSLKPLLASIPGVVNADVSLKESPAEYTFSLNRDKMELYSLNTAYVGSALRMAISGVEATNVIINGKETKVIARFDDQRIPNLEAIQNLQILNLRKQPVFLKDVAKIELKPSVNSITRIDQKRVILLSAGVEGKTRPNAVLAEFQQKVKKDYKLPDGYAIVYGGENEQNNESVYSILRAMVIAGILIISTLIIQFNSFKKAMIVLVAIPLALIGVFLGMAIAGVTLSFPGLIGILALFGIVVKNSIILIDKMNLNIKFGIPFKEAVIDAGKSRLEAIFITSICTIFGIIPVTLSNETWMALGSVVIFGLMLSSFFTLFLVPVMFVAFIDEKQRV